MPNQSFQSQSFDEQKATPQTEYFSGANVRVYFGDVWVDQLAAISFSMQEQVAPIYGFRSYTFDRISRGNRYVQGEIILQFTENGYLQTILDRVASGMERESVALETQSIPTSYLRNLNEEQNIKDLLAMDTREGGSYKDQIEALKDSFWGRSGPTTPTSEKKEQDVFYYSEKNGQRNILREHGFNILIDYSPDANHRDFEDCINGVASGSSFYQSYRTIVGVHLTGEQQEIVNNGEVLQVRYGFLARDLDADITRPSLWSNFRNTDPSVVSWTNPYKTGASPGANSNSSTAHQAQI